MGAKVARACDACRVRKVKCSGSRPCAQCSHLSLACVFAPGPGKRKPGVRGRLVAQLRSRGGGMGTGTTVVVSPSSSLSSSAASSPGSQHHQHQHHQHPVTSIAAIVDGGGGVTTCSPAVPPAPTATHNDSLTTGCSSAPAVTTAPVAPSAPIYNDSSAPAVTTACPSAPAAPPIYTDSSAHTGPSAHPASSAPTTDSVSSTAFSRDFFLRLLPEYHQQVYPVNPILTPSELRAAIDNMHHDSQDAALAHAFAAVTLNLTRPSLANGDITAQMSRLIHLSLCAHARAHRTPSALHADLPVSVKRIMTCIFNQITLMAFKRFDRSLALLREAIAMIQMLRVHEYAQLHIDDLGVAEVARRQRMYWEAYIHERFLCIMSGFPCTMVPLASGLPLPDTALPARVSLGFNRLILLFRIMDGPLLAHASSAAPHPQTPVTASWIERKQAELDRDEADAAAAAAALSKSGHASLSELQHVDLFVTRLWLRTLVWQLALSHRLLRSAPPSHGLSLHFPVQRLSSQLRALVSRLESVASIVIHGSGLLQKLFEITSTVADVLALPPGLHLHAESTRVHMDDFLFLVRFLFGFERVAKHQRDYLAEKLASLRLIYTTIDFGNLAEPSPT